jgi:lysophospholipase
MDLHETPGNPIPPNAIVAPARTRDGVTLRVARWTVRAPRGTVTIAMGRSEFIEEYAEIVAALIARDLEVVIFDWRGQGLSDRESGQGGRGHVSRFSAYKNDLEAIEQQVLRPFASRPWFALGHSMGGAILLDQAHDGRSPFDRLVLSAPMIDISLRHKSLVRWLVRIADWIGFGAMMIPGGREESLFLTRPFAGNILTGDARQYERLKVATTQLPRLAIGAPTIRWLNGAFDLMARFALPRYPVETLTPILIIAGGADTLVDTAAIERFAIRLKAGRCVTIPGARHQVIMERPAIDAQFWAAFDAFIPGEAVEAVATAVPAREQKLRRRG